MAVGARTRGHPTSKRPKTKQAQRVVDFVIVMNAVAEDMEADVIMRDLSRQDLGCEHWMLALSDSESD